METVVFKLKKEFMLPAHIHRPSVSLLLFQMLEKVELWTWDLYNFSDCFTNSVGQQPINEFMHCSTWTLENEILRKQPVKQETPQTSQKEMQRSRPKVSAQSRCRD